MLDITEFFKDRPDTDTREFRDMTLAAEEIVWHKDGLVMLVPYQDMHYLVAKSTTKKRDNVIIRADEDTKYTLGFLKTIIDTINNSTKPVITDVDGESKFMRKTLVKFGFVEIEEDIYLLEK
jgi:hypothetical protein